MTKVLISGGSIGGPALAYWLVRYGFEVTIVETAPALRLGGQAVDVRGPALEVAERMGVLDAVRAARVRMRGMSMVDGDGDELYRSEEHTITGGDLAGPDVEILREDLSVLLADAAGGVDGGPVEWLFDDSIAALEDTGDAVRVVFRGGAVRDFDIVVGADGLHSNTRRLAFGPEEDCIRHLGTYMGVWAAPNTLGLDEWQVFHQAPGGSWGGGVMTVRENRELRVYLGFEAPEPIAYDHRDRRAQQALLRERLANAGWEIPNLLDAMDADPGFHFDAMAQIHLDSWSRGRVVLLGDAGYCGSPLSGQGTSMAMVGAYVLAGELKAAGGDHRAAFAAYERELRPYATANQELALTNRARAEAQQAGEDAGVPDFAEVVAGIDLTSY
ncbi:FAD-dependent monooxygenase [Actinomadura parmotrematis]|uniref:FAD-dependent monooxygenase n=1 Tax=Actinomadura parmotrematis TaxID=2864039 RepID=A0ABS7FQ86_9ACTN|nr:FAD-dependent monooxygenase [Actinomadura parmotrematis]MBW8482130.1 FAD-dependent monooxygenase [Actinomadura parmotrematis]